MRPLVERGKETGRWGRRRGARFDGPCRTLNLGGLDMGVGLCLSYGTMASIEPCEAGEPGEKQHGKKGEAEHVGNPLPRSEAFPKPPTHQALNRCMKRSPNHGLDWAWYHSYGLGLAGQCRHRAAEQPILLRILPLDMHMDMACRSIANGLQATRGRGAARPERRLLPDAGR